MTRMSKQGERRNKSPRKHRLAATKTGPLKENLPLGYKEHANAASNQLALVAFVPKVR